MRSLTLFHDLEEEGGWDRIGERLRETVGDLVGGFGVTVLEGREEGNGGLVREVQGGSF